MFPTLNTQAQLADLGLSIACTYANMAMSGVLAATSLAFAVPFVLGAVRPARLQGAGAEGEPSPPSQSASDAYSAYRSDGGHATTLVLMGAWPAQ